MLASITPLGERGRQSTWAVTVTAFLLGGVAGGAAIGALAGAVGSVVLPRATTPNTRLIALAAIVLLAIVLDARSDPAPGPRRQVNERWLHRYRGWVYGLGFGAQLGFGVSTVVSSAATYVAIAAAFLTRSPASGALVLGCFGLIRGLTPLAAARIDRTDRLIAFHSRLDRARGLTIRTGVVGLGMILAVSIAGAAS
jgi:sulfite exporter TauE/SafE